MNSSPVASSFPFISSDLTSDNGIFYGINRHNNSLILFDRFSLQNANIGGLCHFRRRKSYAIKLEVLRSLMMGTDVIIIDPENEYKHFSDAVGGTYINISLTSESKINPFDLPRPRRRGKPTGDIIRSAVITLKGLMRIDAGQFDSSRKIHLIDRALLETYAKKDITPDSGFIQSGSRRLCRICRKFWRAWKAEPIWLMRLKKYTEGTFAGLFNNPTNVEMNNQLVVFSVRDLEDELRPIAIYTIVNYIWNVVRSEMKKRILVIDEAWWLMQQ